jgi:hypothetical protein
VTTVPATSATLQFPIPQPPENGTMMEVAPGVLWLRLTLPFRLDHVNVYLLEDGPGYALVDTGIGDEPSRLPGSLVSPAVFDILRATPALGRFFTSGEDVEGAAPVAVLSDQLWRERYGSDPAVCGKTILIDGRAHTIVGVARPGLRFPSRTALFWMPYLLPTDDAGAARGVPFSAIGRLRPGVTTAQAEAEGTAAARSIPRAPSAEFLISRNFAGGMPSPAMSTSPFCRRRSATSGS